MPAPNEQQLFDAKMREEFDSYCKSKQIFGHDFREDIWPVFSYAYRAGAQNMMLDNHQPGDFHGR